MSSQKKTRNILSLPFTSENVQCNNRNEKSFYNCLGEVILDNSKTPDNWLSTNSSELEGFLDLGIKLSGLSSSSSFCWSEEYDLEISKKVHLELEKLDRIFQGIENDPAPYDISEINEWKHFFPNLYILGQNTPRNSPENSDDSECSDNENLTKLYGNENSTHKPLFTKHQSSVVNRRQNLNHSSLPRKPKSLELDQCLQISPIFTRSLDTRGRTKPSPSRRESKDLSPEYTSLPFITTTPIKAESRKRFQRSKPARTLLLPPIETTFRSISATPRQASSKSMFLSLNYKRDSSENKKRQAEMLKSDLMKLFDSIPITNR